MAACMRGDCGCRWRVAGSWTGCATRVCNHIRATMLQCVGRRALVRRGTCTAQQQTHAHHQGRRGHRATAACVRLRPPPAACLGCRCARGSAAQSRGTRARPPPGTPVRSQPASRPADTGRSSMVGSLSSHAWFTPRLHTRPRPANARTSSSAWWNACRNASSCSSSSVTAPGSPSPQPSCCWQGTPVAAACVCVCVCKQMRHQCLMAAQGQGRGSRRSVHTRQHTAVQRPPLSSARSRHAPPARPPRRPSSLSA
jgi:hypothetical protein